MKNKDRRLEAIKMIVSGQDISCQEELLKELGKQGFKMTQATLSRDLKQLKVAKASSMTGKYVYVLPNSTVYRRLPENDSPIREMISIPCPPSPARDRKICPRPRCHP